MGGWRGTGQHYPWVQVEEEEVKGQEPHVSR